MTPLLVTRQHELDAVAARAGAAEVLAFDGEGDGLHAYRAKLCAMQLAWLEGGAQIVAVIDALALDLGPLRRLLGPLGPIKVLHDLTFDARMLQDRDVELGHARDTSVAARFLGVEATGLASLCEARFGVKLSKRLQDHNWAERPFTPAQLEYLAGDVRHLLELDEQLMADAQKADIIDEIADECRYKLLTALRPPKETRPAWARIKGYKTLPDVDKAVLQRLCAQRERIAERLDRPPFKIAGNDVLLDLAKAKPQRSADIRKRLQHGPARFTSEWLAAIMRGRADGVPQRVRSAPPPAISRQEGALRQQLDDAIGRWRRAEAKRRGVDMQVVMPGHCVTDAVAALARCSERDDMSAALRSVEGMGDKRIAQYGTALEDMALAIIAQKRAPAALPGGG